jgi:SAM-dependent methyltransferase
MTREGARPKRLLSWTGERMVPWGDEASIIHEHLHRYLFSEQLVEGKAVLDLGSGEGYGSDILARSAKSVVGLELDTLAVAHARLNYDSHNLLFVEGSVLELGDFEDSSFDVVVCFEVIEHLSDHERLVAGVARVLRDDGLFVVSTPDRMIYNEALGYPNPYHLKELDRSEFESLLSGHFSNVTVYGQRAVFGSVLSPLEGAGETGLDASRLAVQNEGGRWKVVSSPSPKFFLAIASQQPLPPMPKESLLMDAGLQEAPEASFRVSHPILGVAIMGGRSVVHLIRKRAALFMRERNRKRAGRVES